jgi:hypothetical protein
MDVVCGKADENNRWLACERTVKENNSVRGNVKQYENETLGSFIRYSSAERKAAGVYASADSAFIGCDPFGQILRFPVSGPLISKL